MKKTTPAKMKRAIEKWKEHSAANYCFDIEDMIYLRDSHPHEEESFYLETHLKSLVRSIRIGIAMTRDYYKHLEEMKKLHFSN